MLHHSIVINNDYNQFVNIEQLKRVVGVRRRCININVIADKEHERKCSPAMLALSIIY